VTTAVSNAVAPADDRPLVSAVKQQAKRLLRLAKKTPLEISALSQALEVASQMHGYPSWHALSVSTGRPAPTTESRGAESNGITDGLIPTNTPEHVERLASQARFWAKDPTASVNIITPHFQALKQMPGMEGVRFVSTEELLRLNPLAIPVGSRGLLPAHASLFSGLVTALVNDHTQEIPVRSTVSAILDIAQDLPRQTYYAPGMIPQELLPDMEYSPHTTWNEVRNRCIMEGSFESAAYIQSRTVLAMRVALLCGQMKTDLIPKKQLLKGFTTDPVLQEKIEAVLDLWDGSDQVGLPPNGVVVFELDIANIDWTLSPEHQWLLAAYLGYARRLPSAIAQERADLPGKSYCIRDQDMVWIRSIAPEEREAVFAWYGSQVPGLIFDVWDEFEGPVRSWWVKEFSEYLFHATRRFQGEATRVVTWVGYRPSPEGEVPCRVKETAMAKAR
jgi:hypothetical protein